MRLFTIAVGLVCISFCFCNKVEKSKKLFDQGKIHEALVVLQDVLAKDPQNPEANEYFALCQTHLQLQKIDSLVKTNQLEEALSLIETSTNYDPLVFKKVIHALVKQIEISVENELIPGRQWDNALQKIERALKFNEDLPALWALKARVLFERDRKYTWRVVLAVEKGNQLNPDEAFCKQHVQIIAKQKVPFINAFNDYQKSIVKGDFRRWLAYLHPGYIKYINDDLPRLKEKYPDDGYNTIQDYFTKGISQELAGQGSPEGAQVTGIDLTAPNRATVHYTMKNWMWNEQMDVVYEKGRYVFLQPDRSEMPHQ